MNAPTIPEAELSFLFSRAGGPGGQNVNRRETRVQLRWDAANSPTLSAEQKARLLAHPAVRHLLDTDGAMQIVVDTHRSQPMNRAAAIERLHEVLKVALRPKKKRVATKATRGSKERRLKAKKQRAQTKAGRRGGHDD